MSQTALYRIDDPKDERQKDLAHELADETRIVAVSPVPNGHGIRVWFEKTRVPPRAVFSTPRKHGYAVDSISVDDAKDIRSRIRAFTGRFRSFEHESYSYADLIPMGVPEFTCDLCDEHKRGERSSRRYKPESEQESDGHPKEMYTLCRGCDPHYGDDGEYIAEPETERIQV